jgi:hypothetical protein
MKLALTGLTGLAAVCAVYVSVPASAMPIAPPMASGVSSDLLWVGHGHGHHYGWYHGRGHHYGWWRGRHRGWWH